jgi:hypothetical protein
VAEALGLATQRLPMVEDDHPLSEEITLAERLLDEFADY